MEIKRRGFLGAILAAGVAPAFIGSSILMPVKAIALPAALDVPLQTIITGAATLLPGDTFTIAGVLKNGKPNLFQVLKVHSGGGIVEVA